MTAHRPKTRFVLRKASKTDLSRLWLSTKSTATCDPEGTYTKSSSCEGLEATKNSLIVRLFSHPGAMGTPIRKLTDEKKT
jgi:hypothetical protein